MTTTSVAGAGFTQKATLSIILAVAFCHGINDIMQSLLTAIYPILKSTYGLDYVQLGILTLTFQCTASLLQPVIGIYTDKHPLPYSIAAGMGSSVLGLIVLGVSHDYPMLLLGAALIGFGSAVFHPESSRVARLASGGRHGFAQSTFQVGGNAGQAAGPLLAAFVVLPHGQWSVAWFGVAAFGGMLILTWVGRWYAEHRRRAANRPPVSTALPFDRTTTVWALVVLVLLTLTKNVYTAGMGNYFTFYVIEKFGVDIATSQIMLFLFLGASAVGVFIGGPIGDRFGARFVIWFSIIGALPFALLLPYADFTWAAILSVLVGMIISSCFPAIVVFAQELLPGRIGMVAGIFFGFAFGAGGIGAALLGALADSAGIETLFRVTSYLPLLGFLAILLPDVRRKPALA